VTALPLRHGSRAAASFNRPLIRVFDRIPHAGRNTRRHHRVKPGNDGKAGARPGRAESAVNRTAAGHAGAWLGWGLCDPVSFRRQPLGELAPGEAGVEAALGDQLVMGVFGESGFAESAPGRVLMNQSWGRAAAAMSALGPTPVANSRIGELPLCAIRRHP